MTGEQRAALDDAVTAALDALGDAPLAAAGPVPADRDFVLEASVFQLDLYGSEGLRFDRVD